MSEPTSSLTFGDLVVEVARKLNVAYYGPDGDEVAQVPDDVHDLSECKHIVNNAIRMFMSNAPINGWRWTRPIATVVLWPDVAVAAAVTVTSTYEPATATTLVTASAATFYPSMELKTIIVTDVDSYTVSSYVSTTQVRVSGNQVWSGSKTFSIASGGDFTLPQTFGGRYTGPITYVADSNLGTFITWESDVKIRRCRAASISAIGYPAWASVRKTATARRWELMLYPTPSELLSVEFPYDLHFDTLTNLTEVHPAGYQFDEAIRAACLAVCERDVEEVTGDAENYYRNIVLLEAHQTDARSAPQRLGYMGNGREQMSLDDYRRYVERPIVTYTP